MDTCGDRIVGEKKLSENRIWCDGCRDEIRPEDHAYCSTCLVVQRDEARYSRGEYLAALRAVLDEALGWLDNHAEPEPGRNLLMRHLRAARRAIRRRSWETEAL